MDYVELNHRKRFPGTWCVVLAFMTSPLILGWAFLDGRMIVVRIMAILIPVMAISSLLDVRTARMDVGNVFNGHGLILRTHGEDNAMISELSENSTWSMMRRVNS